MTMFPKHTRWKSPKWRAAAEGQNCTMRLPGCRNDTSTVVLAHRGGAGMGLKADDHDSCDCCAHCHAIFDRPDRWPFPREEMMELFEAARIETIINRLERAIVK